MEFSNGILLQLFECIESTQNEVKRKMIETVACNSAPKSPARLAREKRFGDIATHSQLFSHRGVCLSLSRFRKAALRCRRDCASRTFARLSAIYNERRLCDDALLKERVQGAQPWPDRMML